MTATSRCVICGESFEVIDVPERIVYTYSSTYIVCAPCAVVYKFLFPHKPRWSKKALQNEIMKVRQLATTQEKDQ